MSKGHYGCVDLNQVFDILHALLTALPALKQIVLFKIEILLFFFVRLEPLHLLRLYIIKVHFFHRTRWIFEESHLLLERTRIQLLVLARHGLPQTLLGAHVILLLRSLLRADLSFDWRSLVLLLSRCVTFILATFYWRVFFRECRNLILHWTCAVFLLFPRLAWFRRAGHDLSFRLTHGTLLWRCLQFLVKFINLLTLEKAVSGLKLL